MMIRRQPGSIKLGGWGAIRKGELLLSILAERVEFLGVNAEQLFPSLRLSNTPPS